MTTKKTRKSAPKNGADHPPLLFNEPIVREAIIEFARLLTKLMKQLHKEFDDQMATTPAGGSAADGFFGRLVAASNGDATKDPVVKPDRTRKRETTRVHAPPPAQIRPPSQPSTSDGPPELE